MKFTQIILQCKHWQTGSKSLRGLVALPSQKGALNLFRLISPIPGKVLRGQILELK